MRPPVPVVLLVASLLLAGPATALAPDELRHMREQVRALADRVEAQQRQIDAQQEALQAAGVSERGGAWGLAPFLAKTDFRKGSVSM